MYMYTFIMTLFKKKYHTDFEYHWLTRFVNWSNIFEGMTDDRFLSSKICMGCTIKFNNNNKIILIVFFFFLSGWPFFEWTCVGPGWDDVRPGRWIFPVCSATRKPDCGANFARPHDDAPPPLWVSTPKMGEPSTAVGNLRASVWIFVLFKCAVPGPPRNAAADVTTRINRTPSGRGIISALAAASSPRKNVRRVSRTANGESDGSRNDLPVRAACHPTPTLLKQAAAI